jgi:hypothetical protein
MIGTALGLVLLAAPAPDASVVLNARIATAVARGERRVDLPDGEILLRSPLRVPGGANGLELVGGVDTVIRPAPGAVLPTLLQVGEYPRHRAVPVAGATPDRSPTVDVRVSPGWYALIGPGVAVHASTGATTPVQGEIVRVVGEQGGRSLLAPGDETGREYPSGTRIQSLEGALTRDVTLRDLTFDGRSGSMVAERLTRFTFVQGLTLENVRLRNFRTDPVEIVFSRDVSIAECEVSGWDSTKGAAGYAFNIVQSRRVEIARSSVRSARKFVLLTGGSLDVRVVDSVAERMFAPAWDVHGQDNRRVTFRRCRGSSLQVGNPMWRLGDRDILVEECEWTEPSQIYPGVRSLVFRSSSLKRLTFHGDGIRPLGDTTLEDCTLVDSAPTLLSLMGAERGIGEVRIRGGTYRNHWPRPDAAILAADRVTSHSRLEIEGATLETAQGDHLFSFGPGSQALRLTLNRNTFRARRGVVKVERQGDVVLEGQGNSHGGLPLVRVSGS